MAATIAARSSFLRPIFRTATRTTRPSTRTRIPFSVSNPSLRSNFTLHQTRISPPSLSRLVRRELSTLQPVHSAVASACLVSELPRDANCAEGSPQVLDRLRTAMTFGAPRKRYKGAIHNRDGCKSLHIATS